MTLKDSSWLLLTLTGKRDLSITKKATETNKHNNINEYMYLYFFLFFSYSSYSSYSFEYFFMCHRIECVLEVNKYPNYV